MNVTIPNTGQYGVIKDLTPQELPINAWSNSSNVRFKNGYVEKFRGERIVFDPPSIVPYFITPYQTNTTRFIVHAGLQQVFVDDGVTRTDITNALNTGAIDNRWTGGSLNGVLVLNNGVNIPQYWGGNIAFNLADLPGWPATARCKSLRPFKNYLVGVGFSVGATTLPHLVRWSNAADPGSIPNQWTATASNDAGEVDLAETTDLMVDSLPLGDVNIIYKQQSMYSMQYIGPPYIFRFARLPGELGLLAPGCVVMTPVGHVVLAGGDVIQHSGQGPKSILSGRMRSWLFNNIDSDLQARSFLALNQSRNEVWICFPEPGATACTKALVWNWEENTFALRDLNQVTYGTNGKIKQSIVSTWDADPDPWNSDVTVWNQDEYGLTEERLLLATVEPKILTVDTGASYDGVYFNSFVERVGLAFDKPDRVKSIRAIYPRIDAIEGTVVKISAGGAMDPEGAVTWSDPVNYIVGSTYKADLFATGRFLAVRFESSDTQPWRIRSFDLDIIDRGRY